MPSGPRGDEAPVPGAGENAVSTNGPISLRDSATEFVPPRKRSAGLAWLLSMVLPGLGHFYCGLMVRGGLVMGFSVVGMAAFWRSTAALASGDRSGEWLIGLAVLNLPVLYVFGFLDAYFTAREINRGVDPSLVDNPRVASVLNFMTKGLGYFYLGERVKGLAVFVGLSLAQALGPAILGGGPIVTNAVSLVAGLLSIVMAVDGYRIGRRAFDAQIEGMELAAEAPPSRLPAVIPLIAGGVVIGLLALVLLAGMMAAALGVGQA